MSDHHCTNRSGRAPLLLLMGQAAASASTHQNSGIRGKTERASVEEFCCDPMADAARLLLDAAAGRRGIGPEHLSSDVHL